MRLSLDFHNWPDVEHWVAIWTIRKRSGTPGSLNGLVGPDPLFQIRDGHHRFFAAEALGIELIPAIIFVATADRRGPKIWRAECRKW